jgi:hypothetical protein
MTRPRDPHLLQRLYGQPPPTEPRRGGWAGVAFVALLAGVAVLGLVGFALSLGGILKDQATREALAARGVVPPGQSMSFYHDHSAARDGSAGCAVVGGRLVRWDDWRRSGELPLAGAQVAATADGLRVEAGEGSVECPFFPGEPVDRVADWLALEARRPQRAAWRGAVDPRWPPPLKAESAPR